MYSLFSLVGRRGNLVQWQQTLSNIHSEGHLIEHWHSKQTAQDVSARKPSSAVSVSAQKPSPYSACTSSLTQCPPCSSNVTGGISLRPKAIPDCRCTKGTNLASRCLTKGSWSPFLWCSSEGWMLECSKGSINIVCRSLVRDGWMQNRITVGQSHHLSTWHKSTWPDLPGLPHL